MIFIKIVCMHILSGNFTNSCLALSNSFWALKQESFINYFIALFAALLEMSFCCFFVLFFREIFFKNLKIVDQYTSGSMNWFAVDIEHHFEIAFKHNTS